MTREEVEDIAEEAADKALRKLMLSMGADISDGEALLKMQRDFQHLRAWRESTDAVKQQGILTAVKVITAAIVGGLLLMLGFKAVS
jgi:hypothetical protein